jgi:hypothetical protein
LVETTKIVSQQIYHHVAPDIGVLLLPGKRAVKVDWSRRQPLIYKAGARSETPSFIAA